jgi:hypothetical protein
MTDLARTLARLEAAKLVRAWDGRVVVDAEGGQLAYLADIAAMLEALPGLPTVSGNALRVVGHPHGALALEILHDGHVVYAADRGPLRPGDTLTLTGLSITLRVRPTA